MKKTIIACDQCGKEEVAKEGILAIFHSGLDVTIFQQTKDTEKHTFCARECMVAFFAKQAPEAPQ